MLAVPAVAPAAEEDSSWGPGRYYCYAEEVKYVSTITKEAVVSSPAWSPGAELPLSLKRALEIARAELAKLVKQPENWELASLTLEHLPGSKPEHWYYAVSFHQDFRGEDISASFRPSNVVVLVDFAGRPGTINPREKGDGPDD